MFVPYVPQERPEHYERRQVGVGLGRQTHFGAGRPIKHPRWNLQPTVRVGCSQVATKDNSARPLNCLMSADPQAGPWMPRIQQLPKLGPVGVLKPCCTIRCERTGHWTKMRQSLARFSGSDVSYRMPWLADCTINTPGSRFSACTARDAKRAARLVLQGWQQTRRPKGGR